MAISKNAPLGLADSIIDDLGSQRTAALQGRLDDAALSYPRISQDFVSERTGRAESQLSAYALI